MSGWTLFVLLTLYCLPRVSNKPRLDGGFFGIWNLKFLLEFRISNLEFKLIHFCAKLKNWGKKSFICATFFSRFFGDCPKALFLGLT
jgi:hypothetical protein